MAKRVFDWDANPAIDKHSFKLNNTRAQALITSGRAKAITLPCGRSAVQFYPPAEELPIAARFDQAWKIKPSGGVPVWQMKSAIRDDRTVIV